LTYGTAPFDVTELVGVIDAGSSHAAAEQLRIVLRRCRPNRFLRNRAEHLLHHIAHPDEPCDHLEHGYSREPSTTSDPVAGDR
jgi:hypothetical protein